MKFIALTSALAAVASATTYHASEAFQGDGFYTGFSFEAIPDPTNGRVQYVDKATAQANNLTFATDDIFILRADRWTTLTAGGPGRQSVRIQSTKAYTNHISVFNVRHMPQGCATWPAMWYADTNNWPGAGEIDVLEGVNDVMPNAASLHTTARCSMPGARTELGAAEQLDCNWLANGNAGCGVSMSTQDSYGPAFNANGGGWFVAERNSAGISVWFWARNDATVPLDVKERHNVVITETWVSENLYIRR
ncbi:concanavalin A-like lectin/glucanase domain-containing protein [Schizophyllum amplum]|uniref:Concanavalin A-like lectin/glucanase domain-containing protein n=1 Tax=Schizophyllum amplum TaxID=97359 RepID=A0A550CP27_9AGAR|nr:concanavalin A-like lectin/glucanase domain-containing protein [Auriculariopsis ampla]